MFKLIGRLVTLFFLVIISIPIYFVYQVWYEAHYPDSKSSDYAVVMGAAQYDGRPSDAFEARLQEALNIYKKGLVKRIVTVGGAAPGDRFTEARTGRHWLIENGVARKDSIELGIGRDTIKSVVSFSEYFKKNDVNEVVIVTDPYHCKRSIYIANDLGINATCAPVKNGPNSINNAPLDNLWRESKAYIAYRTLEKIGIHVSDHLESTGLSVIGLG